MSDCQGGGGPFCREFEHRPYTRSQAADRLLFAYILPMDDTKVGGMCASGSHEPVAGRTGELTVTLLILDCIHSLFAL